MIFAKTTLENPYYFFSGSVLYNISNSQDTENAHTDPSASGCGVHKVIYKTEEKEVERGDWYRDVNGNYVKAEADGTVQASTNIINPEQCATVFPSFYVKYKDRETQEQYKIYYWLQNYIKPGDTLSGGKFTINSAHSATYADFYEKEMKQSLKDSVKAGSTFESLKRSYPIYFFTPSENPAENEKRISVDGEYKDVYYDGVVGITSFTNDQVMNLVYEELDDEVIKFANSLLKDYKKKLKSTAHLITPSNVTQITN